MTSATQQVLTVLHSLSIPDEAKAFVLAVFEGEVGDRATNPWTCEFGYTYYTGSLATFPDASSSPPWTGNPIPGKPGWVSTALGIGQIIHPTWMIWKTLAGAPQDYEPMSQCLLVWLGGQDVYHSVTGGRELSADLRTDSALWPNVQYKLLPTWPGGMRNFASKYQGYLDVIKSGPQVPVPVEIDVPISGETTDSSGKKVSISGTIKILSASAASAVAGIGISAQVMLHNSPVGPSVGGSSLVTTESAYAPKPADFVKEFENCYSVMQKAGLR